MRSRLIYLVALMLLLNACGGDDKSAGPAPSVTPPAEDTSSAAAPAESQPQAQPPTPTEESQPEPAPHKQAVAEPGAPVPAEPRAQAAQPASTDPNADKLDLAKKSGCLACHAVDKKVVGPAWKDVAARYAGDPQAKSKLVEKVAKGGRGNWTDVVGNMAMPPYSPRVSNADIETLVDFVLSLNNT